ncbi:MAG: FeoA family protein [Christensenellales bacterium]|jgi:ferrous iron transport protein A
MPLTMLRSDDEGVIVRISGTPEIKRRLCDMGLAEGSKIRVLSRVYGNLIVEVKNTRFALDRKLANSIKVA